MSLESIVLRHPDSGATARILPELGFNCYSLELVAGGEPVETLASHPDFTSGNQRPSGSGIPLLCPFPGRIRNAQFDFSGRSYELEANHNGHAIHGFAYTRPWRVTERDTVAASGLFEAFAADPSLRERWPADFRLTARYVLSADKLTCRLEVTNIDSRPLPFGLGAHPYFRVPLGKSGNKDACIVRVPATQRWELENMIPTGKRLPVSERDSLRSGLPFGGAQFDDVFTGMEATKGGWPQIESAIYDPGSGRTLTISADAAFRECVVYTPGTRDSICIEPYTCCPDAILLTTHGHDAGLRVLAPGDSFVGSFTISLS